MIKSLASFVLQAIIVVAAVLVFSFFDPFGILAPKKKTLQNTPITVTSIKEIGQLITAEYYGEVLSSLHDSLIAEISNNNDLFERNLTTLNGKYILAIAELHERADSIHARWYRRETDLMKYFYDRNVALIAEPFYQDLVKLVIVKSNNKYKEESDILKVIWKAGRDRKPLDTTQCRIAKAAIKSKKDAELEALKSNKSYRKRQIIGIGRGSVRAGIDFGTFDERNFKYDAAHQVIFLFGVEAKILYCDINPWFNAKAKIKGFEIVAATNQANTPDYLNKLKENCLNKLRAQAVAAGIERKAHENAEESLKHFFSLLLANPVERVVLVKGSLSGFEQSLAMDKSLPTEKLAALDSSVLYIRQADSTSASRLISTLMSKEFKFGLGRYQVSHHTAVAYRAAQDWLITNDEWSQIKALYDSSWTSLDTLWYFPYEQYHAIVIAARDAAAKQTKYQPEGAAFWLDSLRRKKEYVDYTRKFDSIKKSLITQCLNEKRQWARSQAIEVLKNAKTIMIEPGVAVNQPDLEKSLAGLKK